MEELFVKAISRFTNYYSKIQTRNEILEKVLGGKDTQIFDFIGIEELLHSTIETASLIFTNLSFEEVKENIEWYVYEATEMENPMVFSEEDNKIWIVKNPKVLFEMLTYMNEV